MADPRPGILPLLAGIAVASFVAYMASYVPARSLRDLHSIAAFSFTAIGLAALLSALLMRRIKRGDDQFRYWTIAAALTWFIPFALTFRAASLWLLPVAATLSAILHSLLTDPPITLDNPGSSESPFFFSLIQPLGWRVQLQSLFVAILLQGGTVLAGMERPRLGGLAFAAAAWQWGSKRSRLFDAVHAAPSGSRAALHLTAATLVTALFLILRIPGTGTPGAFFSFIPTTTTPTNTSVRTDEGAGPNNPPVSEQDTNIGIILLPENQPSILLAPRLVRHPEMIDPRALVKPLDVPFTGVYWLYRSPHQRPPSDSLVRQGRPDQLRFRSSDGRALSMEARQNLGSHWESSCCSRIEVVVHNNDPRPRPTGVELQLIDTVTGDSHSIGVAEIDSRGPRPLVYRMPASVSFGFDELRLVYHLSGYRHSRSAQVAIERLRFIPR